MTVLPWPTAASSSGDAAVSQRMTSPYIVARVALEEHRMSDPISGCNVVADGLSKQVLSSA